MVEASVGTEFVYVGLVGSSVQYSTQPRALHLAYAQRRSSHRLTWQRRHAQAGRGVELTVLDTLPIGGDARHSYIRDERTADVALISPVPADDWPMLDLMIREAAERQNQ